MTTPIQPRSPNFNQIHTHYTPEEIVTDMGLHIHDMIAPLLEAGDDLDQSKALSVLERLQAPLDSVLKMLKVSKAPFHRTNQVSEAITQVTAAIGHLHHNDIPEAIETLRPLHAASRFWA